MFRKKCEEMEEWSVRSKIILVLFLIAGMCLMGYLLLAFVYLIPTEGMQKNMVQSAQVFENSTYPQLMGTYNSRLDNWTDALMLLNASHIEEGESVFEQAISVKRYSVVDNPHQTLINIYGEGGTDYIEYSYARYWHGYLLFLKPLLVFFDYGTIRYIQMFVQLGIFLMLIVKLTMINKRIVIPTFLMWLFLNPVATMMSLQFSSITIITFLAMFGIVSAYKYLNKCTFFWSIYFCVIGGLTSYFDFLTYPLVSLGVPLTLWLFFYFEENARGYKQCLTKSVFWVIGYLGMWASKWILGSIIIQTNVIEDALKAIYNRMSDSAGDMTFSVMETIQMNFDASSPLMEGIIILEIILHLWAIIKYKRTSWKAFYFVIFFYPFIWYLVATNHSYIHFWMTYRELSISVYAFAVWTVAVFGVRRKSV